MITQDTLAVSGPTSHQLDCIQAELMAGETMHVEPVHYFAEGMYARELTIPAGARIMGKIHRTEHISIISKGAIAVYAEGEGVRVIRAPFTIVARPGCRRLGIALEDTVWTCVHFNPDNEQDLDRLEERYIEPHEIPPELVEHFKQMVASQNQEVLA